MRSWKIGLPRPTGWGLRLQENSAQNGGNLLSQSRPLKPVVFTAAKIAEL